MWTYTGLGMHNRLNISFSTSNYLAQIQYDTHHNRYYRYEYIIKSGHNTEETTWFASFPMIKYDVHTSTTYISWKSVVFYVLKNRGVIYVV